MNIPNPRPLLSLFVVLIVAVHHISPVPGVSSASNSNRLPWLTAADFAPRPSTCSGGLPSSFLLPLLPMPAASTRKQQMTWTATSKTTNNPTTRKEGGVEHCLRHKPIRTLLLLLGATSSAWSSGGGPHVRHGGPFGGQLRSLFPKHLGEKPRVRRLPLLLCLRRGTRLRGGGRRRHVQRHHGNFDGQLVAHLFVLRRAVNLRLLH